EGQRNSSLTQYHHYEFASAALQIGIVLASASIITSTMVLAWLGMALGVAGGALISLGVWAPHVLHGLLILRRRRGGSGHLRGGVPPPLSAQPPNEAEAPAGGGPAAPPAGPAPRAP